MDCPFPIKQSPIDLHPATPTELPELIVEYFPAPLVMESSVRNFDVNVPEGSRMRLGESMFELQSFHFHQPSEHAFDSYFPPMELHFVHLNKEKHIGVLGVKMEIGPANPLIETIWQALPLPSDQPISSPIEIDPNQLLPESLAYYRYKGSLTNEPFDVEVSWHFLKEGITVSENQVAYYRNTFKPNARKLQPRLGRPVYCSEA